MLPKFFLHRQWWHQSLEKCSKQEICGLHVICSNSWCQTLPCSLPQTHVDGHEVSAMAANHNLETQQNFYVSNYLTTMIKNIKIEDDLHPAERVFGGNQTWWPKMFFKMVQMSYKERSVNFFYFFVWLMHCTNSTLAWQLRFRNLLVKNMTKVYWWLMT